MGKKISSNKLMFAILILSMIALLAISTLMMNMGDESNPEDLRMTACFSAESSGRCEEMDPELVTTDSCCDRYSKCCR